MLQAEESSSHISSLSLICMDVILTNSAFRDLTAVLTIYRRVDLMLPLHLPLRTFVIGFLRDRYPMLVESYGRDEMASIFHGEDLELFQAAFDDQCHAKARFASLKGTVLERSPTSKGCKSDDGYYPLEALLQGRAWPSDVDYSKREQYLSPEDFVRVFKMTKEEFGSKKQFVRDRLKRDYKLF
jgi:hypothetical protein